jgi:hypothetical protein
MTTEKQPKCNTCGTEVTINHIFTKFLQYIDEIKNPNIPNTLDAALGPNTHTHTHHQPSLNILKTLQFI